ncbi:MAG: ankyrin repeat domain-containing protein [Candidatus Comchoanobacterales bacterium]
MSKFNLLAAIEEYAKDCKLTKGFFNPRRILNKSPYPWGKTPCPPMILLFQYFNKSQINTFLEKNIDEIEGTAFSKHFTTSSGLSPTKINALSVAKDKGYYKAYLMGVGRLDEDSQKTYLEDIQDIFKKFLSDNSSGIRNYYITKYIKHVPENMKFDILKLQQYETSGPTIFDLIKGRVSHINFISLLANLTKKQKSQLLNAKNNPQLELFVDVLIATWNEDTKTLSSLLKNLPTQQKIELLKTQDYYDRNPLFEAIDYYNTGTIKLLLKGLSPNQKFELFKMQVSYGNTPLHLAITKNSEAIELLLSGLSPVQKLELLKIQSTFGYTLLWKAVNNRKPDTVKILLDGISKDQKFELLKIQTQYFHIETPLSEATQNNDIDSIKLFLEDLSPNQKFELLNMQNARGRRPLDEVIYYRDTYFIELFLEDLSPDQKFDLFEKNARGTAPVFGYLYSSNIKNIETCLKFLSPDQKFKLLKIQDYYGETPLHKAIKYKEHDFIKLLFKDLTAQHRVSLQLDDPESDYQVPDSYQIFLKKNIDITIPYKKLKDKQQSMIDDQLQSMMDHNPELITSHIIPSYQKMKSNSQALHNKSKEQLLGMIENLPEDEKNKHSDLINELKTSLAKQDLTQEESMNLMMQDMSKDKHSSHYKTVEALRFIDKLTKQSSTAVSEEQLSTLIDHAITELTIDLPEKAALKAIRQFKKQFSSVHLKQLEKLLFNVDLYLDNPSSEKPDPSTKNKRSFTSKVSEEFDKTAIQIEQSNIKKIVQSLQDPSSNTHQQSKN